MTIKNARIIATAVNKGGFPDGGVAEIAFVGRSNVGKSSLINALAGRRALARASGTPGKTRTLNFFAMDEAVIFVDLPGYGYAKASKSEIAAWGKMAEGYLKNRAPLKAVVFLLDIRRDFSANDRQMYDWLRYYGVKIIIAATKCDKLNRRDKTESLRKINEATGITPIAFSSADKTGRDELWGAVLSAIAAT